MANLIKSMVGEGERTSLQIRALRGLHSFENRKNVVSIFEFITLLFCAVEIKPRKPSVARLEWTIA
jgi:hypothetical protein